MDSTSSGSTPLSADKHLGLAAPAYYCSGPESLTYGGEEGRIVYYDMTSQFATD